MTQQPEGANSPSCFTILQNSPRQPDRKRLLGLLPLIKASVKEMMSWIQPPHHLHTRNESHRHVHTYTSLRHMPYGTCTHTSLQNPDLYIDAVAGVWAFPGLVQGFGVSGHKK